jgi:hypothetical protein
MDRTNGTVEKTRLARWRKLPPGISVGGIRVAAAELLVATTNIQYSGNREMIVARISTR